MFRRFSRASQPRTRCTKLGGDVPEGPVRTGNKDLTAEPWRNGDLRGEKTERVTT